MALTNAERQARHRERVKERLALPAATEPLRNDPETSAEAFLELIRGRFEDGMIELLEHGDRAFETVEAVRGPRQDAVDRFNALRREGQWRLLLDGLREAGHKAALRIVEDCYREWERAHPQASVVPAVVELKKPRRRRVT